MNDSQKRINAYKELLPGLKEKVAAMLVLLLMSTTMLITVSFAWVALTTSPEVTGVNTSIAANGNLEIALVGEEGNIPDESKVGDSALELIARNITWGNLINLGDPIYGLDHMVLRPAKLNTSNLLDSPLWGAAYATDSENGFSGDGRVETFSSDFAYANWVQGENGEGQFEVPTLGQKYGVRAIASTKLAPGQNEAEMIKKRADAVKSANMSAASEFSSLTNNTQWMNSLAVVMGSYMTQRMNPDDASLSNPSVETVDIGNLRDMYEAFISCFRTEEKAILELANFQLYIAAGGNDDGYVRLTPEDLYNNRADYEKAVTDKTKVNKNIYISNLSQFYKDIVTLERDCQYLELIVKNNGSINWKDEFTTDGIKLTNLTEEERNNYTGDKISFNKIIANMVDVGKCTIGSNNTPISSIGASNAMSYLSGTQEAHITNGIIYRFEERVGKEMDVKNLSISATVKRYGITVPASVKANVSTSIDKNHTPLFTQDYNTVNTSTAGLKLVANDTYGFAIDLWVRTNASGNFLKLEGNVLTEKKVVRATKVINGETYELYSATVTVQDEEGNNHTQEYTLYQKDGLWYNAESYAEFTYTPDSEPIELMTEEEIVIGYEGDNRIWDDAAGLSVNSTTQGSGSCYVYYADTPEDQARSLKLLQHMKIAFVNDKGELLTTAYLDTDKFYASNGKVTVPLVLPQTAISLGVDINGNEQYAIMPLQQNVATRITAIVYLDGEELTNADVLSSADIQGQLNIQFGSSTTLNHMENEELKNQTINISASVDKTSFNYDESSETNPMKTNVTIKVEGTQPNKVTAFFLRAINATQGSREETMTFTYDSDAGVWKSSYTFNTPGNYILRTVMLDGINYDLENPPKVSIDGFTIVSLNWDPGTQNASFMTASSSVSTNMSLSFASNDQNKMPKKVEGRFIREEDGSVNNVIFTYDSGIWKGKVTFSVSGNYSLEFLKLDGDIVAVPNGVDEVSDLRKYATVYLGMKVAVYTDSPTEFFYDLKEFENTPLKKNLKMKVRILDDMDNELPGLTGVNLYYKSQSSITLENGMHTELIWNGDTKYYEGSFRTKVGIYQFYKIDVEVTNDSGSSVNTITRAVTYPKFIVKSVTPPGLVRNDSVAWQFVPKMDDNNYAKFTIKLDKEAAALTGLTAVIVKKGTDGAEDVEYIVTGESNFIPTEDSNGNYNWDIKIPVVEEIGNQEGVWQLMELRIPNVGEYTDENPLVFTFPDSEGKVTEDVIVTVVAEPKVSISVSGTTKFNDVAFLAAQTLKAGTFNISITDSLGNKLDSSKLGTTVTLHYNYNNDSNEYGGYTFSAGQYPEGGFDIVLTRQADGITFKQGTDISVPYAGSYMLTSVVYEINGVSYKMTNGGEYPLPTGAPTIELSSVAPSVKISAITNTGTLSIYDGSSLKSGYTPSISDDKFSATVYFSASEGTGCGTVINYTRPTVTLQLLNKGNAESASLAFIKKSDSSTALVYSNDTHTGTFTWSGSTTTCKRNIGYYKSKTAATDDKTVAGTITADTLILKNSAGVEFQVKLENSITINNPY